MISDVNEILLFLIIYADLKLMGTNASDTQCKSDNDCVPIKPNV